MENNYTMLEFINKHATLFGDRIGGFISVYNRRAYPFWRHEILLKLTLRKLIAWLPTEYEQRTYGPVSVSYEHDNQSYVFVTGLEYLE
jgi:hypothetical protein